MSRLQRYWPVLLLAAWPLSLVVRALLGGQTMIYDDLGYWFYPWKALQYQMVQHGGPSWWNPYEFSGVPHLADIQRQLFYPPNLVFYVLPTPIAMVLFLALHIFLAGWGMYTYLRHFGMAAVSAAAGGLVFSMGSYVMLHLTQLPLSCAVVWVPWWMWGIERLAAPEPPRARALAAQAVILANMILAGSPQALYITALLTLMYCAWLGKLKAFLRLGLATLAGLMLAMPQVLPFLELLQYSVRRGEPDALWSRGLATTWSHLYTLVLPYCRGNPHDSANLGAYDYHEVTLYVGVAALILSAVGLGLGRVNERRLPLFWLGAGLLGLMVAASPSIPISKGITLHDGLMHFPGFSLFRVPSRFTIWCVMAFGVLAACGIERLLHDKEDRINMVKEALAATFIIIGLMVAAPQRPKLDLIVAIICGLGTLVCIFKPRFPVLIVLLMLAELWVFNSQYVKLQPLSDIGQRAIQLQDVTLRMPEGRILSNSSGECPIEFGVWSTYHTLSNIQGSNPLMLNYYIEYIFFSQVGYPLPHANRTGLLNHNGFFIMGPHPENPLLGMLNLKAYFTMSSDSRLRVHPVSQSLGAAWMVPQVQVVPDRWDQWKLLYHNRVDPRLVAMIDEPYPTPLHTSAEPLDATVQVEEYGTDRIVYLVQSNHAGFLVQSEVYYPGWSATVDDRPVPLVKTNGVLRGVAVEAGTHRVVVTFHPRGLLPGVCIALVAVLSLLLEVYSRRPSGIA